MKQHRDFVIYVRNGVAINALVAFSRAVFTPATQTVPASTVEHLTLVYLDPSSSSTQTGEQLRSSIKTEFSVPPLVEGRVNGWKDVADDDGQLAFTAAIQWREYAAALENGMIADGHKHLVRIASDEARTESPSMASIEEAYRKSSGIDGDAGDWTQAGDGTGYPETRGFQHVADTAAALYLALSNKPVADGETPLTDAEKDELADKATADLPETVTAESMAAQDEHDHATGNVDELGRTPNEAVEQENAQKLTVGIGQPATQPEIDTQANQNLG